MIKILLVILLGMSLYLSIPKHSAQPIEPVAFDYDACVKGSNMLENNNFSELRCLQIELEEK